METSFSCTIVNTTIQIWDEHKNRQKHWNAISPAFLNHNPCLSAAISARSCATWHSTKHIILNLIENKDHQHSTLDQVSWGYDLCKQQRREIPSQVTLLGVGQRCKQKQIQRVVVSENDIKNPYPRKAESRNVHTGIMFCETAANMGDVNDKPARNSC
jgi:hypothetical protein